MNTRIQELANQAKNQVAKGILAPDLWIQEYNRIFAELIVRECVGITKHHVMNISTYADADFVEKQILKHFGVDQ